MNGYADLTAYLENSRNCLLRIARHDEKEFSNQSIINAMDRFVKTVGIMEETILVPCRLMDRKVGDSTDTMSVEQQKLHSHYAKKSGKMSFLEALHNADLFSVFSTLGVVKDDLVWGRQVTEDGFESSVGFTTEKPDVRYKQPSALPAPEQQTQNLSSSSSAASDSGSSIKGHIRRPSTVSVASSNSGSTLSDSESEISAENDSGIESESNAAEDKSTELARQFRTHLLGLYRSLEQMTEAANYLTARYQQEVGPA